MKIIKNEYETICDVKGCDRYAEYRLIMDVGEQSQVCICLKCLGEFYREASEKLTEKEKRNAKKR